MMEYKASTTKHRFWFVETKETVKLLENNSMDEIRQIVISDNLYQQKSEPRLINQFGCIKNRLESIPDEIRRMMITADINTGKLVNFIACMAADRLLFELMYEVYRKKLHLGDTSISDADLNIFFKDKRDQSEKLAAISDATIQKIKQVYCRYMFETGLLKGKITERLVAKPYIDTDLRGALQKNGMDKYLAALTGE